MSSYYFWLGAEAEQYDEIEASRQEYIRVINERRDAQTEADGFITVFPRVA